MATIILSQGHGGKDAGSKGMDGKWERDRVRKFVPLVKKRLTAYGHNVTLKSEKNGSGNFAFSTVSGNLKLSFHFNAYNGKAGGVEVLYKKSDRKKEAAALSRKLAEAMNISDRGAKYRSDLYMMNIGFDYLVELCFHDNQSDLAAYNRNREKAAGVIADFIIDIVGSGKLKVDGSWGKDTTRAAQRILKTTVDGEVSNQPAGYRKRLANCHESSWEFKAKGYEKGSSLVRAIQKLVGTKESGLMDKQTVKALQSFLKKKGFYQGIIGGGLKNLTVKAWQNYLNSRL